jgi:hypothetical protein
LVKLEIFRMGFASTQKFIDDFKGGAVDGAVGNAGIVPVYGGEELDRLPHRLIYRSALRAYRRWGRPVPKLSADA